MSKVATTQSSLSLMSPAEKIARKCITADLETILRDEPSVIDNVTFGELIGFNIEGIEDVVSDLEVLGETGEYDPNRHHDIKVTATITTVPLMTVHVTLADWDGNTPNITTSPTHRTHIDFEASVTICRMGDNEYTMLCEIIDAQAQVNEGGSLGRLYNRTAESFIALYLHKLEHSLTFTRQDITGSSTTV